MLALILSPFTEGGGMSIYAIKGKHMMKLLIFLFLFTHAEEISSDAMDGVFREGVWFIILFLTMWIISFFISTKHAQKYEEKNPLQERRVARRKRELIDRFLTVSHLRDRDKTAVQKRV